MPPPRRIRPLHTFRLFFLTLGSSEPWVEPSSSDSVGFTGEGRFRVAFATPEITRFFAARASPAVDRLSWAFAPLWTPRTFRLEEPPGPLQDLTSHVAQTGDAESSRFDIGDPPSRRTTNRTAQARAVPHARRLKLTQFTTQNAFD